MDDRHRLAQVLDEVELMAGEEHGHPGGGPLGEYLAHDINAGRVQAGERLVEHEQLGFVDQSRCQLDALLVTERECLDFRLALVGQAQPLAPLERARPGLRGSQAVQPGQVLKLLEHPHGRVEPAFFRHVADPAACFLADGLAVPAHLASIDGRHPDDGPHRSGLARSVGAEESEHLTGRNSEAQPIQRQNVAVLAA